MLKELLSYKPDIICLQEVSSRVFSEDLKPFLSSKGFNGFYTQGLNTRHGIAQATFVRIEGIEVLQYEHKHLKNHFLSPTKGSQEFRNKISQVSQSVQLLRFSVRGSNAECILANVHLFYDPSFSDVKVYQALIVCQLTEQFANGCKNILMAGDFNSLPSCDYDGVPLAQANRGWGDPRDEQSGVYRIISKGSLERHHPHHPDSFKNRQPLPNVSSHATSFGPLLNPLGSFRNVYHEFYKRSENFYALVTTKTDSFAGLIDHIFFQGSITLQAVVAGVASADIDLIPNEYFPSDHISIGAEFSIL
mmetsp:Transcript_12787/g.14903  ORF Transcript_12787/g.14903 Transcript_12787/m.14903 type:complete len:305 (+) Transcript_12787:432-1346(+)